MTDYNQLFRLDGKVALVTGAARGIGAEIARALAQAGAKVLISDISPDGEQTARQLSADGEAVAFIQHNVVDEQAWQAAVARAQELFGGLDILVNNAGIETAALITQCDIADFRKVMDINVTGVFLGIKHAMPAMSNGGSIVNLSSIAGLIGTPAHIAYHSSKGAVRTMTKAAAIECAQLESGIRVNSIHPAVVKTDMGDQFLQDFVDLGLMPDLETAATTLKAAHPMGFGRVEDVAAAALYLASDAARWVNGSELVLDGGYTSA